jgi:putative nucleotidyltransferase with HDIG domain
VTATPRFQLADELLRRFAAAMRSSQLYAPGHPIITRNLTSLSAAMQLLHGLERTIIIGIVSDEVIVGDTPIAKADALGTFVRRLQRVGIERISIDRGVTPEEIADLIQAVNTLERRDTLDQPFEFPQLAHIRVGRVAVDQRVEGNLQDMATIRRLYSSSVDVAEDVWDSAQTEGKPDATVARTMIDGLAQAVAENRNALLALTTLKNYDNYTFTHMVNVSILTMGQARGLGIEGDRLREFGLAALMHDIGKVRTPLEILNKTETLTDREYDVMRRHTIDGAEILRRTPDVPTLAPIVAFEHHLRLDGTGYPRGVARHALNIGTMLCSIADVYDAMRSQRQYQEAFPTDRILAVLQAKDGQQFDQHLVRRFVQLIGIYPAGNVVRLDTGEIAVVLSVHAADPYRPRVRVIVGRDGQRLDLPRDISLWESTDDPDRPTTVVAPIHSRDYDFDPLAVM